jgi:NTP pyrophosphatase (non-canonical NTP hydrolase)
MATEGEFAAIIDRLREFREKRGWKFDHTPRNLAASVAIEAGELLEHFQWEAPGEGRACVEAGEAEAAADQFVAEELADVLIYALNLADVLDIDPVKAVNDKITTNELRFPVPGETRPVGGI